MLITADVIEFYDNSSSREQPATPIGEETTNIPIHESNRSKSGGNSNEEYQAIQEAKNCTECSTVPVKSFSELKSGQLVQVTSNFNQDIYGIVEGVTGKKVKVITYPAPTNRLIQTFDISAVKLVTQ